MARRAFKEEVAAGRYEIAAVIALAKSDETLAGIKVSDLLVSLPGIGPKRVVSLMTEAGIAPSRRMRGIGEHQVARLVARLTP